ncbi:MAG: hypothetical protein QF473_10430 [Planctomycetota bacterium]|nr:hypothetical protein [Planctomycetota bacterium]MDP6502204.1 hypothetical protein [Planctomycetota bacterium]
MIRRLLEALFASALYGFSIGAVHSLQLASWNLFKFPLLIILTGGICGVAYYVFALFITDRLTFRDVVQHALTIYRDISILLASLSPVSLFLAKTIVQPHDKDLNEYPFFLGLNVFFIAACGTVALIRRASDLLNNCNVERRQSVLIILSWLAISLFAGGQCAWYLRPYFGVSTIKDIPFIEGSRPDYRGARSFYEAVYHLMDPPPLPDDYRNYLQGH